MTRNPQKINLNKTFILLGLITLYLFWGVHSQAQINLQPFADDPQAVFTQVKKIHGTSLKKITAQFWCFVRWKLFLMKNFRRFLVVPSDASNHAYMRQEWNYGIS